MGRSPTSAIPSARQRSRSAVHWRAKASLREHLGVDGLGVAGARGLERARVAPGERGGPARPGRAPVGVLQHREERPVLEPARLARAEGLELAPAARACARAAKARAARARRARRKTSVSCERRAAGLALRRAGQVGRRRASPRAGAPAARRGAGSPRATTAPGRATRRTRSGRAGAPARAAGPRRRASPRSGARRRPDPRRRAGRAGRWGGAGSRQRRSRIGPYRTLEVLDAPAGPRIVLWAGPSGGRRRSSARATASRAPRPTASAAASTHPPSTSANARWAARRPRPRARAPSPRPAPARTTSPRATRWRAYRLPRFTAPMSTPRSRKRAAPIPTEQHQRRRSRAAGGRPAASGPPRWWCWPRARRGRARPRSSSTNQKAPRAKSQDGSWCGSTS